MPRLASTRNVVVAGHLSVEVGVAEVGVLADDGVRVDRDPVERRLAPRRVVDDGQDTVVVRAAGRGEDPARRSRRRGRPSRAGGSRPRARRRCSRRSGRCPSDPTPAPAATFKLPTTLVPSAVPSGATRTTPASTFSADARTRLTVNVPAPTFVIARRRRLEVRDRQRARGGRDGDGRVVRRAAAAR